MKMRNYTAKKYEKLVENIQDKILQRYMLEEASFIKGINNIEKKTIIDLGAGYGRLLPIIAPFAKKVIAIEINHNMTEELIVRSLNYKNVEVIEGDFFKLENLLPMDLIDPVFLIAQNSLGTLENGIYKDLLTLVAKEARKRNGELILSLLRQGALEEYGITMYRKLKEMVGNVDLERSDFRKGILVTDSGYSTKWWNEKEIEDFKKMGRLVRALKNMNWYLLELSFS